MLSGRKAPELHVAKWNPVSHLRLKRCPEISKGHLIPGDLVFNRFWGVVVIYVFEIWSCGGPGFLALVTLLLQPLVCWGYKSVMSYLSVAFFFMGGVSLDTYPSL